MKIGISVAMTTYNGSRYIIEQLQSIHNQSMHVDEVIICDDQSSDNTVTLVKNFIQTNNLYNWRIVVNEERLGFCFNFWKAISLCSGEIVFLSDQDDVWYLDKVKSMVRVMNSDSNINFVASSYDICDEMGDIINPIVSYGRTRNNGQLEEVQLDYLIGRSPVRGCSICFKRVVINESHHVELKSGLAHDWLIACIASINGRAVFYNKKLFKYRRHGLNTSKLRNKPTISGIYKVIKRRADYLHEENNALNILLTQKSISAPYRQLVIDQLRFSNLRRDLICNMNIKNIFILSRYNTNYCRIHSTGKIGGYKVYLSDVAYAINGKLLNVQTSRQE